MEATISQMLGRWGWGVGGVGGLNMCDVVPVTTEEIW